MYPSIERRVTEEWTQLSSRVKTRGDRKQQQQGRRSATIQSMDANKRIVLRRHSSRVVGTETSTYQQHVQWQDDSLPLTDSRLDKTAAARECKGKVAARQLVCCKMFLSYTFCWWGSASLFFVYLSPRPGMDPWSFGAGEAEQGGHLWVLRRSVNKLPLSWPGSWTVINQKNPSNQWLKIKKIKNKKINKKEEDRKKLLRSYSEREYE
jgi:hypothetical protein